MAGAPSTAQIAMATWPKMEAEGQKDLLGCVILQKTPGPWHDQNQERET